MHIPFKERLEAVYGLSGAVIQLRLLSVSLSPSKGTAIGVRRRNKSAGPKTRVYGDVDTEAKETTVMFAKELTSVEVLVWVSSQGCVESTKIRGVDAPFC